MKILIVENEIYLAQSIASKLTEIGFSCESAATVKEAIKDENYDAVLLSTNISGQNFYPVIEKYKNAMILLMVSYISNDTVSNPLKAGANDYIIKPFMMEELIRKLNHLKEYKFLKNQNKTYSKYIKNSFDGINIKKLDKKINFPILIKTNYQKYADYLAFEFAKDNNYDIKFVWASEFDSSYDLESKEILYITEFQNLKKNEKIKLLEFAKDKKIIISSTDQNEDVSINSIEIENGNKIFDKSDVMSIDEYVRYVILNFQFKFPDTELSKKLGISRKSLWEKRKKYGIEKKK